MQVPEPIKALIKKGALFVINTSGGKDSQAMTIKLHEIIPTCQLVLIHSHLPEVEWEGTKKHIENTAMGINVFFAQANKTFFEMVEHRQKFPSPSTRQCTSDLKRGPIQKFINNYVKVMGFDTVVNCMGLRAEESPARSKKIVFRKRDDLSSRNRTQYEWLPIHDLTIDMVWKTINNAVKNLIGLTKRACPA